MKNFLANKHNIALSAYITDKNPSSITTNGALTIIDNSEPSQHISGLVPNSYSIFLDNLFLASGYGFSAYTYFEKAMDVIKNYEPAYSYILDTFNDLRNKTFNLEYSYSQSENKIDKVYNSYGWIKEYKKLDIQRKDDHTYLISLITNSNISHITNVELEIIGGENIYGEKYVKDDNDPNNIVNSLTYNYFDLSYSAEVKCWFKKNNSNNKSEFKTNGPDIYFDNKLVDFNDNNWPRDDGNYVYITYNFEKPQKNQTKDISLICLRDNDVVYSHIFTNAIKWRHKILPFNIEKVNALSELSLDTILALDNINFSDNSFDITNQSNSSILTELLNFVTNNANNMIYLDDNTEIEFSGIGYKYSGDNEQIIHTFMHDYILILSNSAKIDFYFNGIKNNCWNYIEFNNNDEIYRLYQSSQRYIGKHIWTIKYNE